jgi:hypothetical protein
VLGYFGFALVDVRDIARLHLLEMTTPSAAPINNAFEA